MAEIYTVCSYKGGVAKTTTAIHLAAYLNTLGRTLLIDGDPNRSALEWSQGGALPFDVADANADTADTAGYDFAVVDTAARPTRAEIADLVIAGAVFVVPTSPEVMSMNSAGMVAAALTRANAASVAVLLTIVPPKPSHEGAGGRAYLVNVLRLPVMRAEIPRLGAYTKASAESLTVDRVNDKQAARAWAAYVDFGKELINGRSR